MVSQRAGIPDDLSTRARRVVVDTWAFRTRAERESELRFRRLAGELKETGAEPVVVSLALRGARDEHRHAQLCAAMCARYGGEVPSRPGHDHPAQGTGLAKRDAVLHEVVSFCCIAETINAQFLSTILQKAKEPRILRAVRRLLKDEVVHGKVGWAHLAAERQKGRGGFLSQTLTGMIAGSVDPSLFADGDDPVDAEATAHGELPRSTRVGIFASSLKEILFPGFDSFGLDTSAAKAWASARVPGYAQLTDTPESDAPPTSTPSNHPAAR